MSKLRVVTKEEFDNFIEMYNCCLDINVAHFFQPPLITYNDKSKGKWPKSVVASKSEVWDKDYNQTGHFEYKILSE